MLKWYEQSGMEGDVVISTRIRLARNLAATPFPSALTADQRHEITEKVRAATASLEEFDYLEMENMLPRNALAMVERHLISPEFAANSKGSAVLLKQDESVSVMINEEDHLRIQVMSSGLALTQVYETADTLDTTLDTALTFAFDERLGYLTQCPTNLGTGMRASVMLHLPALQERGVINQLAGTVSKLGLTIRGLYGEGSKSEGAMYQLSNQITLGISEQSALDNLGGIAAQIIREERSARGALAEQNLRLEDTVWRSLGLLSHARMMTHNEFMTLCSNLRLGVSLGYLPHITHDLLNKLTNDIQPAVLMTEAGRDMTSEERDHQRAKTIQTHLSQ